MEAVIEAKGGEGSFESDVGRVLGGLRAAFGELLSAVPAEVRRPSQLQSALGLDKKLAWQVYRIATSTDPIAAGLQVPGPSAMGRLLKSAARHDLSSDCVHAVQSSFDDYSELLEKHAGSRSAFDSMIGGLTTEGSNQVDLQHKRAAFRAQSHIWGVQARTQLSCFIFRPSAADPMLVDLAWIRGLIGLRRFRREASWTIARKRITDDVGKICDPTTEPLDPASEPSHGVCLMREFCSRPIPELRSVSRGDLVNVEIESDRIGNMSTTTCLIGDVSRTAGNRYAHEDNRSHICQTLVRTPCEVLIHDVIIEQGMFGEISPEAYVLGDESGQGAPALARSCDRLSLVESVNLIGKGPSALQTPDVTRYREMAQFTFDRLGWDGERFEVYRCRVEYPVMPSSVVVHFELPQP